MSLEEGSRDEQGFEVALAALDLEGVNGDVIRHVDLEIIFFTQKMINQIWMPMISSQLTIPRYTTNFVNAIIGDLMGCIIFGAAVAGFIYQEIQ